MIYFHILLTVNNFLSLKDVILIKFQPIPTRQFLKKGQFLHKPWQSLVMTIKQQDYQMRAHIQQVLLLTYQINTKPGKLIQTGAREGFFFFLGEVFHVSKSTHLRVINYPKHSKKHNLQPSSLVNPRKMCKGSNLISHNRKLSLKL